MPEWNNDRELFSLMHSTLYTPVVGDILDELGYYHQFLPQPIHSMTDQMVLAGRAMPVLMANCYGTQERPFGKLIEALDQLQKGEIYIGTGCDFTCATWGELLTATAKTRGAVGAVLNGFHRDTPKVLEQNWPVFSRGRYAQDSAPRMKVSDFRISIEMEKVKVNPGDLIFGDLDGVLIIPQKIEDKVIEKALEKARGEKIVRREIENGMSSTEAFNKYGIL